MANSEKAVIEEDEELEIPTDEEQEVEEEQPNEEEETGETPEDSDSKDDASDDEDSEGVEEEEEFQIEIEGETPTPDEEKEEEKQEAPQWVKDLRKENRELKKKLKAQEKKEEKKEIVLGKEPEMDDPDIDYDKAIFKEKWNKWNSEKLAFDKQESEKKAEEKRQKEQWQQVEESYQDKKAQLVKSLKLESFDDIEEQIGETLSVPQQGIVLSGAENPAMVFAALTKPEAQPTLEKLSAIKDPVKFAFAVSKLESKMKVTKRRPTTKPERKIDGASPVKNAGDAKLEELRAQAEKTNDYSKVTAYKRKMRAAKR